MEQVMQVPPSSILMAVDKTTTITGVVNGAVSVRPDGPGTWRVRYPVQVRHYKVTGPDVSVQAATGGLLVSVRQNRAVPEVEIGDTLIATGKIKRFYPYKNPGMADWSAGLAIRGIDARLAVLPENIRFLSTGDRGSIRNRLANWRIRVQQRLSAAMPETDSALIMGMLFGGYEGIERQTAREFASTGIVHILSVSGAHIALVAGAVFWLCRWLGLSDSWAVVPAALAMAGYGMVSGFSAPVLRSVLMGLLGLVGLSLGRQGSARQVLWLVALAMLVYEPRSLFDISFQLSVGCTAGLLYLYGPLAAWLQGVLPRPITTVISATLAAQLGVLPLLAWYFGSFPLMSLAANLLVAPLLEAVILLSLLAAVLAGGISPLAHFLFVGASLLTGAAVELNRWLSLWPLGILGLPTVGPAGGALYYLLLATFCRWNQRIKQNPVSTLLIFLLFVAGGLGWAYWPGPLQVHFIDVGQGDATLVVTPHGRTILVDAGGNSGGSESFDVGEQVVVPYLRHYGVRRVDWLILTHNHQDHAGGAAAVARFIGVGRVLAQTEDSAMNTALLRLQQAIGGRTPEDPGTIAEFTLDGVNFQLFQAGEPESVSDRTKRSSSEENGRSTVVRLQYGRHSFLLTGDLEGESEKIVAAGTVSPSTVLKVGHHGARKSSRQELLNRINPAYAVISVGADNRFGHPAPETLGRLRERPLCLFRTDRDGAVVFHSDGENLRVKTFVD